MTIDNIMDLHGFSLAAALRLQTFRPKARFFCRFCIQLQFIPLSFPIIRHSVLPVWLVMIHWSSQSQQSRLIHLLGWALFLIYWAVNCRINRGIGCLDREALRNVDSKVCSSLSIYRHRLNMAPNMVFHFILSNVHIEFIVCCHWWEWWSKGMFQSSFCATFAHLGDSCRCFMWLRSPFCPISLIFRQYHRWESGQEWVQLCALFTHSWRSISIPASSRNQSKI
jgi:hypothetical protein